jgi:hypothetical protein
MSNNNTNEIKTSARGKTNGYNSAHLHAKRNRKRSETEARKREHDSLSIKEKIVKAKSRRGESKREIARLTKMLQATEIKVAPKPAAPAPVAETGPAPAPKKRLAKKATKK